MTADVPEFELHISADGHVRFAHPSQAHAYLKAKFGGKDIVGQFYEYRAKRSDRQNRAFHAMVRPWLEAECRGGWTIDALKLWVLGEVFGRLEVTVPSSGEVVYFPAEPHTSRLTMGQFVTLIDRTLELAAEDGVWLQAPDEYRKAKEKVARQLARKETAA